MSKKTGCILLIFIFTFTLLSGCTDKILSAEQNAQGSLEQNTSDNKKNLIKWVDCNVPYSVLLAAYEYDVKYHDDTEKNFNFADALAYLATRNGNNFSVKTDIQRLSDLVLKLNKDNCIDYFYGENKYYLYYKEVFHTIFAEYIGYYIQEETNEHKYGLKAFHPIARGFWYSHSDDFGNARSYGYKRKHLGHDLFGSVGTPIIAIEGGTITHLGWNKYGGWRIGIRSHDKKRSYYYAHLRKDKPYVEHLKIGYQVSPGEVIGYLGVTGYSTKENHNMNGKSHLHLGMQLIFDESQAEGPKEIWIDMYQISKFLSHNRETVIKQANEYINKNTITPVYE